MNIEEKVKMNLLTRGFDNVTIIVVRWRQTQNHKSINN